MLTTDLITEIKSLSKTDKRIFFNELNNEQNDAFIPTAQEIADQEAALLTNLRNQCSIIFAVTVPENVTVPQIKTYLNKWVDDRAVKLASCCDTIAHFKDIQIKEAEANGNTVKAWLHQAIKMYSIYKFAQ